MKNTFNLLGTAVAVGALAAALALSLAGCGAEDGGSPSSPSSPSDSGKGGGLAALFGGSEKTVTDSTIGEIDGYGYELWKDSGDTEMVLKGGGKFSCKWENINNALFRIGKKFDCTKTYTELGNISLDFAADYQPDGNSYLCLYGWTREPLVEYYIVESWGSWRPPGGEPLAEIEVDGGTYDVYRTLRVNQPSIDGNTTFEQYWSVRREKRTEGTVNAAAHFMCWEALGMNLGKLYEASFTVEGYQSRGSAEITKNDLTVGGELPEVNLPEPPKAMEPDENGYYFLEDFENGASWSPRGGDNAERTSEEAFEGGSALKISGRGQSWQGAEISLDSATFKGGESFSFGAALMQNTQESADFKLTLQYNSPAGTNYDCIAEASAQKGEWVILENPEYSIPENSWGLVLYVETAEGTCDFYLDRAYAAVAGTSPEN